MLTLLGLFSLTLQFWLIPDTQVWKQCRHKRHNRLQQALTQLYFSDVTRFTPWRSYPDRSWSSYFNNKSSSRTVTEYPATGSLWTSNDDIHHNKLTSNSPYPGQGHSEQQRGHNQKCRKISSKWSKAGISRDLSHPSSPGCSVPQTLILN